MQFDVVEIKKIMKQKGITQVMIAEQTGVPLRTINEIFRGRTPNPRIDTVQAIYSVVGIKVEQPTLAQQIVDTTLANLNIDDFNNLTPTEQQQVVAVFNSVVSTFKKQK